MFLLLLLVAVLARAQQNLSLNAVADFSAQTNLLAIPAGLELTVSVAVCTSDSTGARFFLSNSGSSAIPGPGGGNGVYEIQLTNGSGQWSGSAPSGGLLAVQDLSQGSFQVSVSDNGAAFQTIDQLPMLGDTTSKQAILFSHPFLAVPIEQPSYPNYTLPPANLSAPDPPSSVPNFTLIVAPTSAQLTSLPQTACALLNSSSVGSVVSNEPWLQGSQGWRSQFFVDGLSPSTNYTAYVIQGALQVSGPIYFATKSESFPCPLVHSLPYCPSTAHAVPLPALSSDPFGYNATTLPDGVASPLLQYMTNFTTMLSTFACGRDLYSPLQTCANCQASYRTWLCSVSFPRCSEPAPGGASPPMGASAQAPLSALQPQPSGSPSRNPNFPNATYDYASLLPCLEMCNAVDRACPYFLGIKCPTTKFNAAASYGVGFIDSGGEGEGEIGNGITGVAQDRWGNVWCNGN